MVKRKQAKVYITEVNSSRTPPLARAREVVSGGALTISLNINSGQLPKVGEVWWVEHLGTRWALYAKVSNDQQNTSGIDDVSSTTLDLFFQAKEEQTKLSYYPVVKFNAAKVSGDPENVAYYIISWTKCTKSGNRISNEQAKQYTWNPNESQDGKDVFVDAESTETFDYSVEIPFEVDNPKTSYYKARIRAVSKSNSTKGPWSPWTKPKLPIRNSLNGPPEVEDVELNFEVKETNNGKLDYRAIVRFKDIGYWDIPGYDFEDDVSSYDVQLQPLEKKVNTYGTLKAQLSKTALTFSVQEIDNSGLPSSLTTAFDVQIGNEIIGIASRSGTKANRTYNIAARGKYSTVAVAHADEAAVKQYDIYAFDDYSNLVPIDPETVPLLRSQVSNKDQTLNDVVYDIDQDDTVTSWPRIAKLATDIKAARTTFNVTVTNDKLLRNLPTALSSFSSSTYLFKVAVRKEVMGVTNWTYNSSTKILNLTVVRGIDSTQADDHKDNAKVRINAWLSVGYLQENITEEENTLKIVEDRILDFDTTDDGIDEDFTIRINGEKMQVISRALKETFELNSKTYYLYEYEVYRAIQNTEIIAHEGGTQSAVEIDLGYYYSATFETIPRPNKIYWRARVRARDRFNRFGTWSDWTDPLRATDDPDVLAPAPTEVAINFNRKHRNRGWSVNAQVSWNKVTYEIPGGDTVDDVRGYQPRLLSSDGSKLAESIGNDVYNVTSRYITDNIAYLVLQSTSLTVDSFSPGQLIQVAIVTPGRADVDQIYNGSHRVLSFDLANKTVAFYKAITGNSLDSESTTGTVTTPQTIIKVYEPEKTNSTQRQLGSGGIGYIFLTSEDLPTGKTLADATDSDYYEMMYVKRSQKSLNGDYYEYFVARGVMGTTPRNFYTKWNFEDVTEPITPMLIFTYPAAFEATKLVDSDAQELEPAGGTRFSQVFGPVRRQYWYVAQVRTLDDANRVGPWSRPSNPATASDNVRPPQPFNINVIPYNNYVKVDWDIQSEPGIFVPDISADVDGELNPDDFEVISSDVSYFKVQLWSEDPHAEAPDEQKAFGLSGNPSYASATTTLTLYTDQNHTFTVGEKVIIKGCWPTVINGEQTVSAIPAPQSFSIQISLNLPVGKTPYQIDGKVYKKGEKQALDLYKQYPIHFFRANSLTDLTKLRLAEQGDICYVNGSGRDDGYYELTNANYRLLSNWKKVLKQNVQIPGLLFYDRYVNLTSRNVPVRKLTNKVWARVCSVDEAGNQSEWVSAGPFNTEFIPGPEWVLTQLYADKYKNDQCWAEVTWAEITSPDFNIGSYNVELQQGRLYAQLYNDSMDFWGLDPNQDIVVGMLSYEITADATALTLNVTEFGESADQGEHIKIGDEIFKVTNREASDDINGFIDAVYTVQRGAVGTTPIAHAAGDLILKVQSEAIIVREIFAPATSNPTNTTTASVTFQDVGDTVTLNNHGFTAGTKISFTVLNGLSDLDILTDYYVKNASANTFQVATAPTGSSITFSSNGTGTISYNISSTPSAANAFDIVIGNERMKVLERVPYSSQTALGTSSTSPTNNPSTSWTIATASSIGTIGSGSENQTGSSAILLSTLPGTTATVWIAVTSNGVWTSTNFTTWTQRNTTSNLRSVGYGNGLWVAVGDGGKILTSTDPTSSWTLSSATPFGTDDIYSVKYGNGTWTIVGENNKIAVSSSLTTSSGVFFRAAEDTVTLLFHGLNNGTKVNFSNILGTTDITSGTDYYVKNAEESTFQLATSPTSTSVVDITTDGLGTINYSNWTLVDPNLDVNLDIFDKAQSGTTVTLTLAQNSNITAGSTIEVAGLGAPYDGNFTVTSATAVSVNMGTSSTFAATKVSYTVSTSGTQSEKTALDLPPTSIGLLRYNININSIAYGAGYWAIACDEGTIATATNPLGPWTIATTPTTKQLNSITYANGYWVTVGQNGTLLTALDPSSTWTSRTITGLSTHIFDVSYGANKWSICGQGGKIFTATDPTSTWTAATTSTSINIYAIYFSSGASPSEWVAAGTNGLVLYAGSNVSNTPGYGNTTGNLWVYLVLRDRRWGSGLGQVEDFQHPDLSPIFDSIVERNTIKEGALEADRDDDNYSWAWFFDLPSTFFYRSRVQGVLKSGVKGNWSKYTLWANPQDLTPPATPIVDADFDAKVLNISWTMPEETTSQIFMVDDQAEMLELNNAKIGDIAVYTTVSNEVTTVNAYRLSALPASTSSNWVPTISPIDDEGNPIDVANDYLYKSDAAAFYQVQVARIPKKWEAVGSLGRLLKNLEQGTGNYTIDIDPGQKLDKYPKAGDKIRIGPGPLAKVTTIKNGLNEVQKVELLRSTAGTFTLSFRGQTTNTISANASASTVETALKALSTIPSNGVTVSSPKAGTWIVKFTGPLAQQTNIPQIVIDGSSLSTAFGSSEVMEIVSAPTNAEDWQKPKVSITVSRSGSTFTHSKGAIVQWVKTNGNDFLDPQKPFSYKWLWKDDKFVTEMSRSYTADHIKKYLFIVRVRAADAAGNFSDWATESVSPSGVPTPDVTSLEFTDVDNTPDTIEGILTFTGSMDPSENIDTFVTELMPTQQIRILNNMSTAATKIFVKRKKKVMDPATVGNYIIYVEDEQVLATARTEVTFKGVAAYRLNVVRAQNSTTAAAHDKGSWAQWFRHFSVKETINGVAYTPSLDATVDADGGTIVSEVPAIGEYKTVFNGIKTGRWYKGRAKAVTDDGKSSSWSDWSSSLRGAKGASTDGAVNTADGPNPVRNLTIDVDRQKIHVFWVEPKPRETSGTADSLTISSIVGSTADSTAVVTTSGNHGFTAGTVGDEGDPADIVTISGAYAPFNGTFTISTATTNTFTIPVEFGVGEPTVYPLTDSATEGDANTQAVVALTNEEEAGESEIDHYIVSIHPSRIVGSSTSPTWSDIQSDNVSQGWITDRNVRGTMKTFKLQSPTSDLPYYARVIAVNADGKKSAVRYARNNKLKPPKPSIDSITISAAGNGNRYIAKIKLLQNRVVTDDEITKYRIEYFWSANKEIDPATVDSIHTSSTPASRIQEGKKIRIGHLPFKKFLFVRIASQNSAGKHSNWTNWRRKKIVTKTIS